MSAPRRIPEVAARGVYYLPWYGSQGEVWIAAVDRDGRRMGEVVVLPGQSVEDAELLLWDLLDRADPPERARRRGLKLVR